MSQEIFEETFEVSAPAKLVVKNIRGNVEVQAGDEGIIKVTAIKHLDSGDQERTSIIIEQNDDGTVAAYTEWDQYGSVFNFGKPCKVVYTIETPAECRVKINTVSGSVLVNGLTGDSKIKTVSGNLNLQNLSGEISANTVSGTLLGDNLTGPLDLDTVSGSIKLKGSQAERLTANSVSGSVRVQAELGEGPHRFHTVSGSVKVIVPTEKAYTLRAKSVSGSFKTDLPATSVEGSRRKWRVELYGGGPQISMKTVSGSMRLLTSADAQGASPKVVRKTRQERLDILGKLEKGESSLEETLQALEA